MIRFNGVSTDELGIVVEHYPQRSLPERSYEVIEVPGRDGDIIIDNGNFKNYRKSYSIFIDADDQDDQSYQETTRKLAEWLLSSPGYHRLEDSYDPDFYQMAYYSGGTNFSNFFNVYGRGTLEFTCAPRRYFKEYENDAYSFMVGDTHTINGPTNMPCDPLIVISVAAMANPSYTADIVLNFDGKVFSLFLTGFNNGGAIEIDTEKKSITNKTGNGTIIYYGSYEDLKIKRGSQIKVVSGVDDHESAIGISSFVIYPRWWTI